jgi:hypothetical protein
VLSRFTAGEHGPDFWVVVWGVAVAAELLALRPVLFDRDEPIQVVEVVF